MIEYQGERFKEFLDNRKIGATEASKILGVSRQSVYQYFKSRNLEIQTVKAIIDKFNTNTEEVFGVKDIPSQSNAKIIGEIPEYNPDEDTKFIELRPGWYKMRIPVVPEYARAGYLAGYADREFLDTLPMHEPIVDKYHRGRYMAFEVTGDSMDDDSKRSVPHGSIVTAREIKRELWRSKFHTHRYPYYVIIHKTDGILIKEMIKHDTENGVITLHSLNEDKEQYPDFDVHLDDVQQIFNVVKKEETY